MTINPFLLPDVAFLFIFSCCSQAVTQQFVYTQPEVI